MMKSLRRHWYVSARSLPLGRLPMTFPLQSGHQNKQRHLLSRPILDESIDECYIGGRYFCNGVLDTYKRSRSS
jgi:hypothetical protein